MKQPLYLALALLALTILSCNDNDSRNPETETLVHLNKSSKDYAQILSNPSVENSDPFELNDVEFEEGIIQISVSYSGGCKPHNFTITWDETIRSSNPPVMNLIVTHDANGDNCEAYITETIEFSLDHLLDSISITNLSISAYSGYSQNDTTTYEAPDYDFDFEQTDTCSLMVTAKQVICGAGLYDNLWLALSDSIHSGHEDFYFSKYLQPVDIDESISGFTPQEGQKYIVGVRIMKEHKYLDATVCMAYSGPSVPVKIMCIEPY
jgi:hypothetical protein